MRKLTGDIYQRLKVGHPIIYYHLFNYLFLNLSYNLFRDLDEE